MQKTIRFAAIASLLAFGAPFALAAPKTITLPADGVALTPSSMPGYAKAQADCTVCHSAEYMLMQPPSTGRKYWDAMTHRMKTVFKAPFNEADIPDIVNYLSATYGDKKP